MQVNGLTFTVGADPEVFVADKTGVISAHGLVKGTKEEPFPVKGGAVQVDGMALEFNVDPADSYEKFQENLDTVQQQLKEMIGDLNFVQSCSNFFDANYMDSQPDIAKMLGCEPDFNAYTGMENPSPNAGATLRTTGGHVHIGGFFTEAPYSMEHMSLSSRLIKLMDEEVGIYSILWDEDDMRRTLYGKAGAFRPKKYGAEYRTMSNKWIFSKGLTEFVYRGVERAINRFFDFDYEPSEFAMSVINKSDRKNQFFVGNKHANEIGKILGVS